MQRYRKNQKLAITLQENLRKKMKIVGIGNVLVDELMRISSVNLLNELQLPVGSMTLIDERTYESLAHIRERFTPEVATGGSAGNTIKALAGCGGETAFVGRFARDAQGRAYTACLQHMGIENRLVPAEGHTGICTSLVLPNGERTMATYLGVSAGLSARDIRPECFEGCNLAHVEGYLVQDHALIERVMDVALECGVSLSLDLASYNIVEENRAFLTRLVERGMSIVFANEQESLTFTGDTDAELSLSHLADMAPTVVQKRGDAGSVAVRNGERVEVQAEPVPVVDTTGAGDFYAGGFLYGVSRGATLAQCAHAGSLLSSYVIRRMGCELSAGQWNEIRLKLADIIH